MARIRFHEPDNNGNVVSNLMVNHRNSTVGLEKIDGATIVVSEGGSFGLKRRESIRERDEVLANQPFNVFAVR